MLAGTSQGVDVTELKAILNSEDSETTKTDKILCLLKANKKLLEARFVLDRNLLHVAIANHYDELTKALVIHYPELLAMQNRAGQAPLHFLAGKNYNEELLNIIFTADTSLINLRDKEGKTPLYYAMQESNLKAVNQLIAAGANPYIADCGGINPYALAHKKNKLLFALRILRSDASNKAKVFPALTHRQTDSKALDDLVQQFSIMSVTANKHAVISDNLTPSAERTSSGGTQRTMLTASESPILTASSTTSSSEPSTPSTPLSSRKLIRPEHCTTTPREMIQKGDVIGLKRYLEQGGDPNAFYLGESLITNAFLAATKNYSLASELYQCQLEQFILLLNYVRAKNKKNNNSNLINYVDSQNSIHIAILQQILKSLSEQIKRSAKNSNAYLQQLEVQYETRLYQAGITEFAIIPTTIDPLNEEVNFFSLLWQLCSAVVDDCPNRKFDNVYISNMLQAILTLGSADKVVEALNQFWLKFDGNQKLVAHFVLKELLIWDVHHELCRDDNFLQEMKSFQENMQRSFPEHGRPLNAFLNDILAVKSASYESVVQENYHTISTWLALPRFMKQTPSLERLIVTGAQKEGHEQHEILCHVAHEFSALMALKMRMIRISEFYDKAWSGKDNKSQAPNILAQTQATNHIIEFIQLLILNATSPFEVTNRLRFLILLARELCSSQSELGPDMASVIILVGALNSSFISRLKENFSLLEPEIQIIFSQLNELTGNRLNYKWLRAVESGYLCPIPHLGIILGDVTFAYDGNTMENGSTFAKVAPFLGPKLKRILQLQRQLLQTPSYLQTDIHYIARAYTGVGEDDLFDKSYQLASPRIDIHHFTFDELLTEVSASVSKNILPRYVFNKVEYSEKDAIKAVFLKFKSLIEHMPPELRTSVEMPAKKLLHSLARLINLKSESHRVNYLYYCTQLDTLVTTEARPLITPAFQLQQQSSSSSQTERSESVKHKLKSPFQSFKPGDIRPFV